MIWYFLAGWLVLSVIVAFALGALIKAAQESDQL